MRDNWLEIMRDSGDLAKELAKSVPSILARPDLRLDEATRLFRILDRHTRQIKSVVQDIEEDDDRDHSSLVAANTLEEIYSDLTATVIERMNELRNK